MLFPYQPCTDTGEVGEMKTNHRRGFVAKKHTDSAMFSTSAKALVADKSIYASIGNDFTKGNRGMAKAKRGAKKFVRSRVRFHDKAATRKMAQEVEHS